MAAIITEGISKSYGSLLALNDIRFSTEEGEMFGLIGPDGAGKTTLFRILTTLLLADKGRATVAGLDVVKDYKNVRNCIGYMPGRFSLYQDLTVEENLNFFATVFHTTVAENYDLIADIYRQIEPFKTRRAGKLSGGMKQKLALSCALIHRPKVLFLDEPTTGVDPVSRQEFWEMLKRLREQGISILVSTPYMDEAARCDRIALIQKGRILQIDTPADIVTSYTEALWAISTDHMHRVLKDVRAFGTTASAFSFGETVHATFSAPLQPQALHDFLSAHDHGDIHIAPTSPGVEDCFIRLLKAHGSSEV